MIDKIFFKQQYLSSKIRTQSWFQENVERWKRREDEQALKVMLKHMEQANVGELDKLQMEGGNDVLV